MNPLDRFSQAAAEDAQKPKPVTRDDLAALQLAHNARLRIGHAIEELGKAWDVGHNFTDQICQLQDVLSDIEAVERRIRE